MYRLLRPLLFWLDAERTHHLVTGLFSALMRLPPLRWWVARRHRVDDPRLAQRVLGLPFASPVGLAAGFDKNARLYRAMAALGFGSVEVGTVTARAQAGNPRPRLFRLPRDGALVNRMGFNNDGARAVARRLSSRGAVRWRERGLPLGINIGRSKVVPNAQALSDYLVSLEALWSYASWVTVNVSSPNTPELRELQTREHLLPLLATLRARLDELADEAGQVAPPLLVKIAPDLDDDALAAICDVVREAGVDGVICGNTTVSRDGLLSSAERVERLGPGGLSGPPLRERMLAMVGRLRRRLGAATPIIACGGVDDAETAWRAICAGASLIQLYTGLVYKGPRVVRDIHRGLSRRLDAHGLSSLADAVGCASEAD